MTRLQSPVPPWKGEPVKESEQRIAEGMARRHIHDKLSEVNKVYLKFLKENRWWAGQSYSVAMSALPL